MTRILCAGLVAMFLALVPLVVIAGEEAAPETEPLPYGEYLAVLEQLSSATSATTEHLDQDSTKVEVAAAYEQMVRRVETDQPRLRELVPEPCYAAAHREMLAYRETGIALMREAVPAVAESETLGDVGAIFEAIDADLRAHHPTAFVETAGPGGGSDGSWRNILAASATCETDVAPNMQRIEYSAEGVAITLPLTWTALPPDTLTNEFVLGVFGSDMHGTCGIVKGPAGGVDTIEEVLEEFLPASYWAELAESYSTARVGTAAGEAVKVTFLEKRQDLAATYWNAIFVVPKGEWLYFVQCTAEEGLHVPPSDDWLSIAETLEVLPAQA